MPLYALPCILSYAILGKGLIFDEVEINGVGFWLFHDNLELPSKEVLESIVINEIALELPKEAESLTSLILDFYQNCRGSQVGVDSQLSAFRIDERKPILELPECRYREVDPSGCICGLVEEPPMTSCSWDIAREIHSFVYCPLFSFMRNLDRIKRRERKIPFIRQQGFLVLRARDLGMI